MDAKDKAKLRRLMDALEGAAQHRGSGPPEGWPRIEALRKDARAKIAEFCEELAARKPAAAKAKKPAK